MFELFGDFGFLLFSLLVHITDILRTKIVLKLSKEFTVHEGTQKWVLNCLIFIQSRICLHQFFSPLCALQIHSTLFKISDNY